MQHKLYAMYAFAPFFVNSFHVKIGLKCLTFVHAICPIVLFFFIQTSPWPSQLHITLSHAFTTAESVLLGFSVKGRDRLKNVILLNKEARSSAV